MGPHLAVPQKRRDGCFNLSMDLLPPLKQTISCLYDVMFFSCKKKVDLTSFPNMSGSYSKKRAANKREIKIGNEWLWQGSPFSLLAQRLIGIDDNIQVCYGNAHCVARLACVLSVIFCFF